MEPIDGQVFENIAVKHSTAKAYLIVFADGKERWVPRSQVLAIGEGAVEVTQWLADKWLEEGAK